MRACRSIGGGPVDVVVDGFVLGAICSLDVFCAVLMRLVSSTYTLMVSGHPVAVSRLPSPSLKLMIMAFEALSRRPP